MPSPLFRNAVLASRRDTWLGEAQVIQPLSVKATSVVCAVLVASIGLFATFGVYTRRVHAEGILAPKTGLITIASPTAGRISSAAAQEGANTIAQADGTRKQVVLQQQLTQSLKDRSDQLKQALAKGLALADSLQNQNYLYIQANAQLVEFEQSGLRLAGKIADIKAQLAEFDSKLARDLAEMDEQIAKLEQQIAESEAKHAIEIRAPQQGILTSLRVHAGQQVPAGGTLITLLPDVGDLRADLYVDSSAIGFVGKGEPVMLRYAAFPFERFGLHRGEVSDVTRAPINVDDDPGKATAADGGPVRQGLYRITVKPDQQFVKAYGEKRPLEAGMQVQADVALEKRPLYKWLLDPIHHLTRSANLVTKGATP